ncbi:MAG: magnesium transporter CorA family protein [Burkholderiaceae bacterium]|nr:magnesium transporter CorA family protein [Burkholderiaceae bacterium]
MELLHLSAAGPLALATPPNQLPSGGFVWCALSQDELSTDPHTWLTQLERWVGVPLLELHLRDLLNTQHPSNHDDTRHYDLVILRQLATPADSPSTATGTTPSHAPPIATSRPRKRLGPPILARLHTLPVGMVVFERLLLSVHAEHCPTRADMLQRLVAMSPGKLPTSPADLMLRMASHLVDRFLDLRKPLTDQLDHWEAALLDPGTRFVNWRALLAARNHLHALEDLCDSQRNALQKWLRNLEEQSTSHEAAAVLNERELLRARSRDVIEHIDRMVRHVQRLATNTETAVQMHFSAQSHRTNEIMKMLTALTAIFLPLNFITGFFGMNFEFLPLIHTSLGLWWAVGAMVVVAGALGIVFWRNRYLARSQT